jgi:hypothetical protein
MEKVNQKIKEILSEPMKLDFIPQYKSNLKYMVQWTLGELRNSVYGDDDAMDTLTEIIKSAKLN